MIISFIRRWFEKQRVRRVDNNLDNNAVYLTFDDGPEPIVTEYVLNQLDKFGAKGAFFCCGNNVAKYPSLYQLIIDNGHLVGSHTMSHIRGDQTSSLVYLKEALKFRSIYGTSVIRPPYGSLKRIQLFMLAILRFKIILWSVDSMDSFVTPIDKIDVYKIADKVNYGDILLFHFSEEHRERTEYILPRLLEILFNKGFTFSALPIEQL